MTVRIYHSPSAPSTELARRLGEAIEGSAVHPYPDGYSGATAHEVAIYVGDGPNPVPRRVAGLLWNNEDRDMDQALAQLLTAANLAMNYKPLLYKPDTSSRSKDPGPQSISGLRNELGKPYQPGHRSKRKHRQTIAEENTETTDE